LVIIDLRYIVPNPVKMPPFAKVKKLAVRAFRSTLQLLRSVNHGGAEDKILLSRQNEGARPGNFSFFEPNALDLRSCQPRHGEFHLQALTGYGDLCASGTI
jgi:hypothetical protein